LFLSGVYFALGAIWSNTFEGGFISSFASLPGELSTFSLMSLTDVLGDAKVFIVGNSAIPTAKLTIVAQTIIFIVAIILNYFFYTHKEMGA